MSRRKSHEQFVQELSRKNSHFANGEFSVIGRYVSSSTKIECQCIKHGRFDATPTHLLSRNQGCPLCAPNHKKAPKEFEDELARLNPDIQLLGEYEKSNIKVSVKCKKCGHEWSAKSNALQQGSGCPRCARTSTSRAEQFICVYLETIFGREKVLSRDKTLIGKELDIVCGGHAWEYGSWAWHKSESKLRSDIEKIALCNKRGITLHVVYDSCPDGEIERLSQYASCFRFDFWEERDHATLKKLCLSWTVEMGVNVDGGRVDWDAIENKAASRCRAMSQEEFVERVNALFGGSVEVCGTYRDMHSRVPLKCKKCGFTWETSAASVLRGHGCRKCARIVTVENRTGKTAPKTTSSYLEELRQKNAHFNAAEFSVLGEYSSSTGRIKCRCNICGHEWEAVAGYLLNRGSYCPRCAHSEASKKTSAKWALSHKEFALRVKKLNPDIELVSEFSDMRKRVSCRCLKCGYEWTAIAHSLSQGSGCPACSNNVLFRGHNDLATLRSDIAADWHPVLNGSMRPCDVISGAAVSAWWRCSKCGNEWQATVSDRVSKGTGCPECARRKRRKPVVCVETNETFASCSDAARAIGLKSAAGISESAKKPSKTADGYHWRYLEENE